MVTAPVDVDRLVVRPGDEVFGDGWISQHSLVKNGWLLDYFDAAITGPTADAIELSVQRDGLAAATSTAANGRVTGTWTGHSVEVRAIKVRAMARPPKLTKHGKIFTPSEVERLVEDIPDSLVPSVGRVSGSSAPGGIRDLCIGIRYVSEDWVAWRHSSAAAAHFQLQPLLRPVG